MNGPTQISKRSPIAHLAITLVIGCAALALFSACEAGIECRPVTINSGCEARCARVIKKDGKQLMCTDQLLATETGENAILQTKTKKITTMKLDKEVCFPVVDRKVGDEAIRMELGNQCHRR